MEAKAYLRHARISPRKVQIVLDLIRNKPVEEATAILNLTPKAACEPLAKLLKSAIANAENNFRSFRQSKISCCRFRCIFQASQTDILGYCNHLPLRSLSIAFYCFQ